MYLQGCKLHDDGARLASFNISIISSRLILIFGSKYLTDFLPLITSKNSGLFLPNRVPKNFLTRFPPSSNN